MLLFITRVTHGMVENTFIVGDVIVAVTFAVWRKVHIVPFRLACENIRFSLLLVDGDVSRETSPAAKSEEKRMFSQATFRLPFVLSDMSPRTNFLRVSWDIGFSMKPD